MTFQQQQQQQQQQKVKKNMNDLTSETKVQL
jgi:hypothetical protein